MSNQPEGRGASSMTTATKTALIVAACSLAVAVYYYTTPTHFVGHDGSIFGCGSPMSPNKDGLAKGQCGILEKVYLHKALLFLALSLIIAALGFLLLGAPRGAAARDDLDDDAAERSSGLSTRDARRRRLGDEDAPAAPAEDSVRRSGARHLDVAETEAPSRRRLARLDESDPEV